MSRSLRTNRAATRQNALYAAPGALPADSGAGVSGYIHTVASPQPGGHLRTLHSGCGLVMASWLWSENFGTYSAQVAAQDRSQPVLAGYSGAARGAG
jgi:hypothetical protein